MSIASCKEDLSHKDIATLIAEIINTADAVQDEKKVVLAKLKIDVRKWVVETVLLKNDSNREPGGTESPISVTIGMDAPA